MYPVELPVFSQQQLDILQKRAEEASFAQFKQKIRKMTADFKKETQIIFKFKILTRLDLQNFRGIFGLQSKLFENLPGLQRRLRLLKFPPNMFCPLTNK